MICSRSAVSRYWNEMSSVTCSPSSVRASRLDVLTVSPSLSPAETAPILTVCRVFGKMMNWWPRPMKCRPPV